MKKAIAILCAVALLSFNTNEEKTYTIKLTEKELNTVWETLNGVQQVLTQSNLPYNTVVASVQRLDSAKTLIAKQVQSQLKTK